MVDINGNMEKNRGKRKHLESSIKKKRKIIRKDSFKHKIISVNAQVNQNKYWF